MRRLVAFVSALHAVVARESAVSGWGMALELSRALPQVGCPSHAGGIAVDVGARGGGETRLALDAGYTVLGVECSADAFKSYANKYSLESRVDAHFGCASNHSGFATFHIAGDSSSLHQEAVSTREDERKKRPKKVSSRTVQVPLLVVDELLARSKVAGDGRQVCAVKIDVQGNELGVFQGMVHTLARYRPVLYFEHAVVNLGKRHAELLIPWVQAKGYHCHPHSRIVCEYCNVLCTPDVNVTHTAPAPTNGKRVPKSKRGSWFGRS